MNGKSEKVEKRKTACYTGYVHLLMGEKYASLKKKINPVRYRYPPRSPDRLRFFYLEEREARCFRRSGKNLKRNFKKLFLLNVFLRFGD